MNKKEKRILYKWLVVIGLVLVCNLFVMRLAFVYGESMEPTLEQGDWVLVWKLGYKVRVGDIVVTDADNPLGQSVIKRVLATEGQKVSIHAGEVCVDGQWRMNFESGEEPGEEVDLFVPDGQVFLLGDNASQSTDSRTIGCFLEENIMGKVIVRVFPFTG